LAKCRNKQFDKNKAELDALRAKAEAQVKRWLTRRQEEKFKKLCGKSFRELDMMTIPGFDWKREDLRREKEATKEEPKKED
jgi:hypothetical protein